MTKFLRLKLNIFDEGILQKKNNKNRHFFIISLDIFALSRHTPFSQYIKTKQSFVASYDNISRICEKKKKNNERKLF